MKNFRGFLLALFVIAAVAATVTKVTMNQMLNAGDNDLWAFQQLGSSVKAAPVGLSTYTVINNGSALADQTLYLTAIKIPAAVTLTGFNIWINTAGSYTGNNYDGIGLYSYSGGTCTLVASSTNSATLWTAAQGKLQIPFSSTYAASPGVYFLGVLYCRSAETTAPKVYASVPSTVTETLDFTNSAKLYGQLTGKTSLPSSFAMSGVSLGNTLVYALGY
jgi:hypothetical protein